MSTMEEAVAHVLAERELAEKVAAAREEQREACWRVVDQWFARHPPPNSSPADLIRAVPLTATPLADTIKDLRADAVNATRVVAQLHEDMNNIADEDDRGHHLIDAADGEPPGESSVDTLATRVEQLLAQRKTLTEERDALKAEVDEAQEEASCAGVSNDWGSLAGSIHVLRSERNTARADLEAVRAERDALRAAGVDLAKAFGKPK